eukprot:scaffold8095_cov82-Skeletonema_dohrnii-CCMP3373.AAC.2
MDCGKIYRDSYVELNSLNCNEKAIAKRFDILMRGSGAMVALEMAQTDSDSPHHTTYSGTKETDIN